MSSLPDHIARLQRDLLASPPRISAYRDLPFAILLYHPRQERELRTHIRRLRAGLEAAGKRVTLVSLAELLWEALDGTEGVEAFVEQERFEGFAAVERIINGYLTDPELACLPDRLAKRLAELDPERDIAILVRAAAMAPALYHMSTLLDEMQGRTMVPTIICYPGTIEGATGLRFMDLPSREPMGNYRVEIYRDA
jgi:hypothetical protein